MTHYIIQFKTAHTKGWIDYGNPVWGADTDYEVEPVLYSKNEALIRATDLSFCKGYTALRIMKVKRTEYRRVK